MRTRRCGKAAQDRGGTRQGHKKRCVEEGGPNGQGTARRGKQKELEHRVAGAGRQSERAERRACVHCQIPYVREPAILAHSPPQSTLCEYPPSATPLFFDINPPHTHLARADHRVRDQMGEIALQLGDARAHEIAASELPFERILVGPRVDKIPPVSNIQQVGERLRKRTYTD